MEISLIVQDNSLKYPLLDRKIFERQQWVTSVQLYLQKFWSNLYNIQFIYTKKENWPLIFYLTFVIFTFKILRKISNYYVRISPIKVTNKLLVATGVYNY